MPPDSGSSRGTPIYLERGRKGGALVLQTIFADSGIPLRSGHPIPHMAKDVAGRGVQHPSPILRRHTARKMSGVMSGGGHEALRASANSSSAKSFRQIEIGPTAFIFSLLFFFKPVHVEPRVHLPSDLDVSKVMCSRSCSTYCHRVFAPHNDRSNAPLGKLGNQSKRSSSYFLAPNR
jgi:hypothetical protein